MNDLTILITGSSGFLGGHLLDFFIKKGYTLIGIRRSTSNTCRINSFSDRVIFYDIDKIKIQDVFENHKIDVVINAVTNYGRLDSNLLTMLDANLMFGVELLEKSIFNNVKAFLNIDTLLDKDISAYALSKSHMVDWMCFLSNKKIKMVNIKLEHMYGVKDDKGKFIYWLIDQLKRDVREIKLTSGIQKRDFIYVSDVVEACEIIISNLNNLSNYEEFEVGTGHSVYVKEFVELIYKKMSEKQDINTILNFGAVNYRVNEPMNIVANITKLETLGWNPKVSIVDGVNKMIRDLQPPRL